MYTKYFWYRLWSHLICSVGSGEIYLAGWHWSWKISIHFVLNRISFNNLIEKNYLVFQQSVKSLEDCAWYFKLKNFNKTCENINLLELFILFWGSKELRKGIWYHSAAFKERDVKVECGEQKMEQFNYESWKKKPG